jgi:hypothetical protein
MKLGLMTAFSRSSGDSSNSTTITNQTREFIRDEFSRSLEWAAYLSTALEINEWNRIQATYFKKHIASEDISNSTNIIDDEENLNYGFHLQNTALNPANDYGPDAIYYGAAWDITPLTRDLEIYQFNGHHQFGERGVKLDWGITRSFAREERPHSSAHRVVLIMRLLRARRHGRLGQLAPAQHVAQVELPGSPRAAKSALYHHCARQRLVEGDHGGAT